MGSYSIDSVLVVPLKEGRVWRDTNLEDSEIPVVQGSVVNLDEDIMVAELGDGGAGVELQIIEAGLALDGPLTSRGWGHCVRLLMFDVAEVS